MTKGYLSHENMVAQQALYTYNPASGNVRDILRLELGDTNVQGAGQTAILSDAEYDALISISGDKPYSFLKIKCLEAILAKLRYQVSFSIDGMSYSLSDRIKNFEALLTEWKKTGGTPPDTLFGKPIHAFGSNQGTNHYFHENMLTNPRRSGEND